MVRSRRRIVVRTALLALLAAVLGLAGTASAWAGTTGSASPDTVGTNDYPYANSAVDQPDQWGFLTRECTSFVAWRLNNDEGIPFSNSYGGVSWGNAENWANAARAIGLPVDGNATPGSIAVFPSSLPGSGGYGHVAYVLSVSGGSMTLEDYNWNPYAYDQHSMGISDYGVQFIHFQSGGGTATGTVQTGGIPLTVRSGPGTGYDAVGSLSDGSTVTIGCQTTGDTVDGNWGETNVWDRIGDSQYITDGFVYTGSNGAVAPPC